MQRSVVRLAAAGRTEQRDELALGDLEAICRAMTRLCLKL